MSTELQNRLRVIALEPLDHICFDGPKLIENSWSKLKQDLLNFCIDHDIVTLEKITKVVSSRLAWLGQSSFHAMMRGAGIKPSGVASQQLLAYVIRSGALTEKEVASIPFEDGQTAATFCPEVGVNFVEEVITALRTSHG